MEENVTNNVVQVALKQFFYNFCDSILWNYLFCLCMHNNVHSENEPMLSDCTTQLHRTPGQNKRNDHDSNCPQNASTTFYKSTLDLRKKRIVETVPFFHCWSPCKSSSKIIPQCNGRGFGSKCRSWLVPDGRDTKVDLCSVIAEN